ncbi:MAG: long-chain fatty acid--CoA ligase [Mariprofundaceae bacterium]
MLDKTGLERCQRVDSLAELLLDTPDCWLGRPALAYREDAHWHWINWREVRQRVLRVASWLHSIGIQPGDHVGILGHNSVEWLVADFAILRLGAVSVPAYFTDAPEAVRYIFDDAECKMVLSEPGEQQSKLDASKVPVFPLRGEGNLNLKSVSMSQNYDGVLSLPFPNRDDLATLIYTSGTTGHPKGVMLTHGNMLADVEAGLGAVQIHAQDRFLSFLPVSHAFERAIGHFLPVACGTSIAYAEDITTLLRDISEVRPTVMISVPRLYEKIYHGVHEKLMRAPRWVQKLFEKAQALGTERFQLQQQGSDLLGSRRLLWKCLDAIFHGGLRKKLGGDLRLFISGGAALHPDIARFLLAADICVLPGYGLSEAAPVLSVNRESHIKPETVGPALPGVDLRIANDGELLAKGNMVMQGYWKQPEATAEVLTHEGWLHTGDIAEIDDEGFVRIVDRKKEIIVLSNGENIPPSTVEQQLQRDPITLQAMVMGEGKAHLSALLAIDATALKKAWRMDMKAPLPEVWNDDEMMQKWLHKRMQSQLSELPSYMQLQTIYIVADEWSQFNGLLTPTLKLKRKAIAERYSTLIG